MAEDVLEALKQAQETIRQQQALLEELTKPPWHLATVSAVYDHTLILDNDVEVPRDKADKSLIGEQVRVNKAGQIVARSPYEKYGATGVVSRMDSGLIQVGVDAGTLTVGFTKVPVEVGDEVVLNAAGTVILRKLTPQVRYAFGEDTCINWDDIGGLAEAKQALKESFERPYTHPAIFKLFGKGPSKGFLLHGRPGNGKTMLGKAVATTIAKLHGKTDGAAKFLYIKGPEILSKWVGESEERIRQMFMQGRKYHAQHKHPAVLFVDEADAILGVRGAHTVSGMEHTIVPQFLSEMDGLNESESIVLLATNRADTLDPAVVRPGRIDRKLYIGAPSRNDAVEIFTIHMRNLPVDGDTGELIELAAAAMFSKHYPLYNIEPDSGPNLKFTLADLVSGAMIKGVVDAAVSVAIERNIATKGKPTGLTEGDFEQAYDIIAREQYGLNHDTELKEFLDERGLEPITITPIQRRVSHEPRTEASAR
jgi:proteasome-associated ATPase